MGKRSNFPRRARDFYATTAEGAAPLLPFLRRDGVTTFAEICVGQGDLKRHLEADGLRCVYEGDIVSGRDALGLTLADLNGGIPITNPPTKYPDENPRGSTCRLLCDLVQHFLDLGTPAWWFIHHDWVTTLRAVPFLAHCSDIVPAPRIKSIREFRARREGFVQLVPGRPRISAILQPDSPSWRSAARAAWNCLRGLRDPVPAGAIDRPVLLGRLPAACPSGRSQRGT